MSDQTFRAPPIVDFTFIPDPVPLNQPVTFTATAFVPVAGYQWDFGDGNVGAGKTIVHVFILPGVYSITLRVTDVSGITNESIKAVSVVNQPPVAVFSFTPDPAQLNQPVTFDASGSYDPDGTIVDYQWDFGDGGVRAGETIAHVFATPSSHTVTLVVTDGFGATDTATGAVSVVNQPPVAVFSFTPDPAQLNQPVTFDASGSYDPDGTIVDYQWDFGDGGVRAGETITHVFATPSSHTVTLVVTDEFGATDTATGTVSVVNQPPVAVFSFTPDPELLNQSVMFDASASYDPDGTVAGYQWDFGDGSGVGKIITHAFTAPGLHSVTLRVSDEFGLTSAISKEVLVRSRVQRPMRRSTCRRSRGIRLLLQFTSNSDNQPEN